MSQVIALVDDDRNILMSVSIALQQEGFVTRVYSEPQGALKAILDNPPDLGVFDIKMPGMDGMELLRRVREASSLPVIFLTSKDDELDEALRAGATRILVDNFSIVDQHEAVRRCRGRAQVEISGGVTLDQIPQIAATGADFVSVGALTHSVRAADLSFELESLAAEEA